MSAINWLASDVQIVDPKILLGKCGAHIDREVLKRGFRRWLDERYPRSQADDLTSMYFNMWVRSFVGYTDDHNNGYELIPWYGGDSGVAFPRFFRQKIDSVFDRWGLPRLSKVQINEVAQLVNQARRDTSVIDGMYAELGAWADWDSGDFYDGGSCWWDDYRGARYAWINHPDMCGSIRFYRLPVRRLRSKSGGAGRAWVVKASSPDILASNGGLIVFNGYGRGITVALAAGVLARYASSVTGTSWGYQALSVYPNDEDCDIYINGNAGCVVAPMDVIKRLDSADDTVYFDLEIYRESFGECDSCGDTIEDEGDAYYLSDSTLCESCYSARAVDCNICGHTFDRRHDEVHEADIRRRRSFGGGWYIDEGYLCGGCYPAFVICDECGYYVEHTHVLTLPDESNVCEACLDRDYVTCDRCGCYVRGELVIDSGSGGLCPDCESDRLLEAQAEQAAYDESIANNYHFNAAV